MDCVEKKKLRKIISQFSFFEAPNFQEKVNLSEMGFKELWELHELVTTTLGQPSVVVDGDDLCTDPGE